MSATIILWAVLSASPKVSSVVVYPDRAQVTRTAEVSCAPGATAVSFEGIPPAADPATLRAVARGATVEGLRSEQRTRAEAYSKRLAALEAELRTANDALAAVDDQAERLQNRSELGAQFESVAVQMVSRDMSAAKPDTRGWGTAFDAALGARLSAAAESAELQAKRRGLAWRIEDLRREQALLGQAAQRHEYLAEVLVRCPAGKLARVELTYLVGGASWAPAYEARSEEPAGVELTTWATVAQHTGEDWTGAKIVLSTAVPAQDATPPELQPLKISAEKREQEKKVLARREERIRHAQVGSGEAGGGEQALAARAQGLSVQLEVPRPGDVPGDGSPVRLLVARSKLRAKFAWRTIPVLAPFVFRAAELTNSAPFPLLAGPLDAFGKSGFIGRYPLERVPQGGAFKLSFGIEDAVKVERTVLEEVQREAGLFNQKKRFRYGYRFELSNYSKAPLELELTDRVPVSELADISVELDRAKTTAGFEVHPQDGTVAWKVKLGPGEQKQVELRFRVDIPDSYDTGGL